MPKALPKRTFITEKQLKNARIPHSSNKECAIDTISTRLCAHSKVAYKGEKHAFRKSYRQFVVYKKRREIKRVEIYDGRHFESRRTKQGFIIAADNAGAGIGDKVLISQGNAARISAENPEVPIDAMIVGVIDAAEEE